MSSTFSKKPAAPAAATKAVPDKGGAKHRALGGVDPFYNTWWYVKAAAKADGAVDAHVSAAVQNVQLSFTDGKATYMDRIPRRTAREPTLKFLCYHDVDGGRLQGVAEPAPVRYTLAIDPATGDAATPQQTADEPPYTPPASVKRMEYTGTFTLDASLPVTAPHGRRGAAPPPEAKKPTAAQTAAAARAEAVRNALASVDGAGAVKGASTVKFHLIRKAHATTLQLTTPSGVVLHLTTDPPTDYSHAAVAASAKASPAFKALSTFKPTAAPAAAPAAAAGATAATAQPAPK